MLRLRRECFRSRNLFRRPMQAEIRTVRRTCPFPCVTGAVPGRRGISVGRLQRQEGLLRCSGRFGSKDSKRHRRGAGTNPLKQAGVLNTSRIVLFLPRRKHKMENGQAWNFLYTSRGRERQLRNFFMQRGFSVQEPDVRLVRHTGAGTTIAHVPRYPHRLLVMASVEDLALLANSAPVRYRIISATL